MNWPDLLFFFSGAFAGWIWGTRATRRNLRHLQTRCQKLAAAFQMEDERARRERVAREGKTYTREEWAEVLRKNPEWAAAFQRYQETNGRENEAHLCHPVFLEPMPHRKEHSC